ncbi:hypothetical protein [Vibrio coralliilyticus]|nr:hypothetical protein [Vibrio coralliilyticus]
MAAIAFTISSTIEEALTTHMYGIGFALLFVISLLFALKKIRDSNK